MNLTVLPGAGLRRIEGPVPTRLAALGTGLLVAMPLVMWIANRSAPLVLALAAVAFVAAGLTAEGWRPAWRRLVMILRSLIGLALVGFILLALISLAWSHRPAQGLAAWGEFVLPVACGAAIMASGRFRPDRRVVRALAGAIIVAIVFMMAELATGLSLRATLEIGRHQGFIFNRPVLTCLMLSAAAFALLRGGAVATRWDAAWLGLLVLAVGWACFGSESGAAGLGFLVMVSVGLTARFAPRLALAAVAAGFAATMALAPVAGRLGDAVLPASLHERLAGSHSRDRVDIWLSFGEAALARPVFGAGFGTSPTLDRHPVAADVKPPRRTLLAVGHPHNAPLQAWVETGALGALLLTLAGLACLARLRRFAAADLAPRLALFAGAFAVASVAHGAWQGWWIAALTAAALWLCAPPPAALSSPPTEAEEAHHG
jgi:O-antigen ligase